MNKIYLILLITLLLLITLSSGCSSSKVERGITQLENETSAITKEITDLKSNLDDNLQKLNADIQKNSSQLENETSTLKKDLDGLKSSISVQVQGLKANIQKNYTQLENKVSALDENIQQLNAGIQTKDRQIITETSAIKKQLADFKSIVQIDETKLENKISAFDENIQKLNTDIQKTINQQKPYWIIAILVLLFTVAGIFFFLKYKMVRLGNILSSELTSSLEKLKNELIQLDAKPLPVPDQKLESENLQVAQEAEPDHSLPIKVCEEIQRMRNRMKHMDQDDQAIKVLRKRLESLEEELNGKGYEMVNLEGKPYNEGMTVKPSFITDKNMKEGEKIITRVIKSQINYKDILIQAAEVEVSQGV